MNKSNATALSIMNPDQEEDMVDFTDANVELIKSLTQMECARITAQYLSRESAAVFKKQAKNDKREAQRIDDLRPVILTQGDLKKLTKAGPSKPKQNGKGKKDFRKGGKIGSGKPVKAGPHAKRNLEGTPILKVSLPIFSPIIHYKTQPSFTT
jgi:hypothetical protein